MSKIIALVPQSPFLIAGTIYENICYGIDREVSIDEVIEASKKAYIYDYISELPDKFNSIISEGGNNLSGGQRQRIAIARIFLRKPKILILDEATSALDNTSEKYIQTEIEKLQIENNTTIISIAHRLTTLKNCDEIIVLNKGKIEEKGKYDELIEKNGIFSDMYYGKLK
ncbi:MAG: ATP-binding cassette domain-containing protein [Clostridia bacterium]|nr:ATP-binding cassette domain-containing protein [Clostridia bacterium]